MHTPFAVRSMDSGIFFLVSVRNDLCEKIQEIAAKAGKHVLLEKPGAIHSKDLQKSFEIAEAKNLNLSVMFQIRYSPEI